MMGKIQKKFLLRVGRSAVCAHAKCRRSSTAVIGGLCEETVSHQPISGRAPYSVPSRRDLFLAHQRSRPPANARGCDPRSFCKIVLESLRSQSFCDLGQQFPLAGEVQPNLFLLARSSAERTHAKSCRPCATVIRGRCEESVSHQPISDQARHRVPSFRSASP
jgi:hypothetical protein